VQLDRMRKQANFGDNNEIKAAQVAAIDYVMKQNCDQKETELARSICYQSAGLKNSTALPETNWGIYNYYYNEGKCDYMAATTLEDG